MLSEIKTYILVEYGAGTGTLLTIALQWQHISERIIETATLALIGGAFGALGGIIVAKVPRIFSWILKKIKR